MRRLPTTTSAIINFVVWDADHGQTSQQWSCEWMLSCSKTFYAALFIVFDHVVVLRHRHSVNDNRTRRTFSRLKGFLWFSGWFNDWDQFVVSFPSHHQLYSLTGQWMNVAVTPRCRCLSRYLLKGKTWKCSTKRMINAPLNPSKASKGPFIVFEHKQ